MGKDPAERETHTSEVVNASNAQYVILSYEKAFARDVHLSLDEE